MKASLPLPLSQVFGTRPVSWGVSAQIPLPQLTSNFHPMVSVTTKAVVPLDELGLLEQAPSVQRTQKMED
jgi:hypothetical protein